MFSAYESEKDAIVANYKGIFLLEGVSYYVRQTLPPAPIVNLDTGIDKCYTAGSDVLVACTDAGAIALSSTQDGMVGLDVTEPSNTDGRLGFSYEAVAGGCVKDKRTGLIWEVKTNDGGLRDMNKTYTNYDDSTKKQKGTNTEYPTAAEIALPTNTIGFVNLVNSSQLCGYTDWRLPTVDELQGLVDYGVDSVTIDTTWFPNTASGSFASSTSAYYDSLVWDVSFNGGSTVVDGRDQAQASYLRLVRGKIVETASRYTYSSKGDEVFDAKTGLTWQRCAAGMVWSGSTCTGTSSLYVLFQAWEYAETQAKSSGKAWRLPNVKELNSITDKSKVYPAIDTTAFPATPFEKLYWSFSPDIHGFGYVWGVYFYAGNTGSTKKDDTGKVRLVRNSQ